MKKQSCLWVLITLFLALAALAASAFSDDCYFRRQGPTLLLGNSKLELSVDAVHGTVLQIRNKMTNTVYLGPAHHGNFRLVYSTFALHGAEEGDPWSAAFGTLIDGSVQRVSAARFRRQGDGAVLEVSYSKLQLEKHAVNVSITYSIEIVPASAETKWRICIDNQDSGTIQQAQFPFISGLVRLPSLLMPNHSGELLRDPVGKLSDETPDVHLEYPARASMQWFDYFSKRGGLYLASYDQNLNYTRLHFGRGGQDSSTVAMWIDKFPFAVSKSSWKSPVLALGVHSGDWHWGGDTYRLWLESWVPPSELSKHIQEMIDSDPDIEFKDPAGKIEHRYEDAPPRARMRPPGTGLMFAGWIPDGHDSFYPEYVPMPDLGGIDALTSAIDQMHKDGRFASAYMNLRLAAGKSPTYIGDMGGGVLVKTPGIGIAKLSSGELHEDWNETWRLADTGEGFHVVMCPSGNVWQDHLVSSAERIIRDYHFNGIFLDQPGSFYSELCYNKHHGHSSPANAWGPGYMAMLKRIRRNTRSINLESYLWIEGINDAYAQFLDFGMDKNAVWLPMRSHPESESFPEMWRYTRPNSIIVDNPKAYSFPPSQDDVYGDSYNFVMGIRGYGMLDDFQHVTDAQKAARRAVLEKISRLWRADGEAFFKGEFRDDVGLTVIPPSTLAKVYRTSAGVTIAMWNTADRPVEPTLRVNLNQAGLSDDVKSVTSLDGGQSVRFEKKGDSLTIRPKTDPHAIDALVIKCGALDQ